MSAYVIGQLKINNREAYQAYLDSFQPSFERHGGELLATSAQETEVLEGSWSLPRTVLMWFPSVDAAKAWYNDPDYQALANIRQANADTNLVIVEGLP